MSEDTDTSTDPTHPPVELQTIFLGGVHLECDQCGELNNEIEIGLHIDDELNTVGIMRYEGCGHVVIDEGECPCWTNAIANALDHIEKHDLTVHDICALDPGCGADDEESDSAP